MSRPRSKCKNDKDEDIKRMSRATSPTKKKDKRFKKNIGFERMAGKKNVKGQSED